MNYPIGSWLFAAPKSNPTFFQWCIQKFTAPKDKTLPNWTHAGVIAPPEGDIPCVFEASMTLNKVPLQSHYEDESANTVYEIWQPLHCTEAELAQAYFKYFKDHAGDDYAFLQIIWFPYAWVCEKLGLPATKHNWFPFSEFCSEIPPGILQIANSFWGSLIAKEMPDGNIIAPNHLYAFLLANKQLFTKLGGNR